MNAAEFVAKWSASTLNEKQGAREHYRDLCEVFGFPTPTDEDVKAESYCFEKGLKKAGGGSGWADVWRRGHFAWEYKSKGKNLEAAFDQLKKYQGNLGNPPLLIACDMDRIIVETLWTGVISKRHEVSLDTFLEPKSQALLQRVFHDRDALKPDVTPERITKEVVKRFEEIAANIRKNQKPNPTQLAHYLTRLVFCLFAEDAGILPGRLFSRIVEKPNRDPRSLNKDIRDLFAAMAAGGSVWGEEVPHVNGSLFDETPALDFQGEHFATFKELATFDWTQMDVSIFGTLFERVMDETKRSQLGAHYTSYDDISTLVEPVVMVPLRREWETVRKRVERLMSGDDRSAEDPHPAFGRPLPGGEVGKGARARDALDPALLGLARRLRQEHSDAEQLMWALVRNRRLGGFKFRRQHPVDPYVLDFYCEEAKLAVELDGGQHNTEDGRRHDERRTEFLARQGIRVVRFWNHEALAETKAVLEAIAQALEAHPSPLPLGEVGRRPGEGESLKSHPPHEKTLSPTLSRGERGREGETREWIGQVLERVRSIRVLDPACGSGNFLYVTLHKLLDLENEILTFCREHELPTGEPEVGPHQLLGIEKNEYAHDIAQMTLWIGYLQWQRRNGYPIERTPILEKLDNIRLMDAILDQTDPDHPSEPEWPAADCIVGNPPFLGVRMLRRELGDTYVDRLFELYRNRVSNAAELCCYWFEKSRAMIEEKRLGRAGLLATQGIRGGANRESLKRIKQTGEIFFAESDRPWTLDGANVHVSMIGFDDGGETVRVLDGKVVPVIHSNLTAASDTTAAQRLAENRGTSFQGPVKVGEFDLSDLFARSLLGNPNPHGRPNSDVLVPWLNGVSITSREVPKWIIDFNERSEKEACLYQLPFDHVFRNVRPERQGIRRERRRIYWWQHGEVNNRLRNAIASLHRFVVTCQTAKHRFYVWTVPPVLPAQTVIAFARPDDYFFGVLHSRAHEVWALKQGTRLETRPRYTPTTCFETFPFPEPTPARKAVIAKAAKLLNERRENWLNPPEWTREDVLEFPGSVDGPWARYVVDPDERGIGTVRYARRVARDTHAPELQRRTLTNLYNEKAEGKHTWLDHLHEALDAAVFAAYGWEGELSDEQILERLLALNLERAGAGAGVGAERENLEEE